MAEPALSARDLEAENAPNCAFCGDPHEGNYAIHRDGFCIGPEVPLCDACGSEPEPTCADIWYEISEVDDE